MSHEVPATAPAMAMTATATETHNFDVVVIGAGFVGVSVGAGLASHAGACRDNDGLDHSRVQIIEQGPECGAFWLGGHEALSLHSPHHRLPHDGGLAYDYPMFKTKHEVRDYMNRYAQNKGLAQCMSFGETVLRISHEPEVDKDRPWRVATDKRELRARRVVVATGLNRQPHIPHIPGSEERAARGGRALRHSWSVSSCDEYKGERVLLVGSGNSAAELAVALHHSGAKSIDILVDGPRHFVRRSTMGQIFRLFPYLSLSTESMVHDLHRCTFGEHTADAKVVTAWERFQEGQDEFIRLLSVDLGPFGIQRPPSWRHAEQQSVAPRIPVYDVDQQRLPRSAGEGGIVGGSAAVGYGVIDLIMSGAVGIKRGRIQRFTSTGVVIEEGASRHVTARAGATKSLTAEAATMKAATAEAATAEAATTALPGGTHHAYDAVILATGFRHRMADFLCAKDGLLHTAASFGAADDAEGAPIIDSCSRSRVIDSIYFVGMDQFRSTTSLDWPP